MKKKKSKVIWVILVLMVVLVGMVGIYISSNSSSQEVSSSTASTIKEVEVSHQTIVNTLTSSGEIASYQIESLELNTYRYFKEIYVEENDFVQEGANILKYTNGTYLVAPYDCVITKISVPDEAGDRCTSMHSIEIQSVVELVMNISIDEEDISKVKVGQEVTIIVNAYEDKTYTGTISKINQVGTYASNGSSFSGVVRFTNDGDVKIGMSATCSIILEKAENVISVPIEAVQTKNNEKYVVVVNNDGSTNDVTITTGISNDAYVEVKSGLTGSETLQMTVQTTSNSGKQNMNMGTGEKSGGFERMNQDRENMPSMPQGERGGK